MTKTQVRQDKVAPGFERTPVIGKAPEGMQRRRGSEDNKFAIPAHIIKDFENNGWSLEWKMHTVYNQGDPGYEVGLRENGWEPVQTDEIPSMMPTGHKGAIIRDGLMLMKRPAYLTSEAKSEDNRRAKDEIRRQREKLGEAPQGQFDRTHEQVRPKIGRTHEALEIPKD